MAYQLLDTEHNSTRCTYSTWNATYEKNRIDKHCITGTCNVELVSKNISLNKPSFNYLGYFCFFSGNVITYYQANEHDDSEFFYAIQYKQYVAHDIGIKRGYIIYTYFFKFSNKPRLKTKHGRKTHLPQSNKRYEAVFEKSIEYSNAYLHFRDKIFKHPFSGSLH